MVAVLPTLFRGVVITNKTFIELIKFEGLLPYLNTSFSYHRLRHADRRHAGRGLFQGPDLDHTSGSNGTYAYALRCRPV
jgi:hypothetical protein